MLVGLSQSRARQGFTPSQTASFVFSLKRPLFAHLKREHGKEPDILAEETWAATEMIDRLGLQTAEAFIKSREEIILRQQEENAGALDAGREALGWRPGASDDRHPGQRRARRSSWRALLQRIVETGAEIAIIDITGVPTVDTLVAQHLLKTVTAARLMGADCIISGIRPQIAQTIVHLGVDLGDVITKATLADAFALALQRTEPSRVGQTSRPAGVGGRRMDRIPILKMGDSSWSRSRWTCTTAWR